MPLIFQLTCDKKKTWLNFQVLWTKSSILQTLVHMFYFMHRGNPTEVNETTHALKVKYMHKYSSG